MGHGTLLAFWLLQASSAAAAPAACDARTIAPRSYRLVTAAQGTNLLEDRHSFWDGFDLGKHEDDLGDLNDTAIALAERALEIDSSNAMAHAILARQYLAVDDPEAAETSFRRAFDAGLAVVWTATLYTSTRARTS